MRVWVLTFLQPSAMRDVDVEQIHALQGLLALHRQGASTVSRQHSSSTEEGSQKLFLTSGKCTILALKRMWEESAKEAVVSQSGGTWICSSSQPTSPCVSTSSMSSLSLPFSLFQFLSFFGCCQHLVGVQPLPLRREHIPFSPGHIS